MSETDSAVKVDTTVPDEHIDNTNGSPAGSENTATAKATGSVVKPKRKKRKNESSVVYVSRVPPGMDIGALRSRLSRMGSLGRVWLRPEEKSAVQERRQLGGRRRIGFQDGWVEFTRRRDAKNAVALLNAQPMNATRRGGRWANDLWCLRLLPRDYTWETLIEETGATARQHVLRVKAAVAAGRRERHLIEEREALARRIARRDAGEDDAEEEEDESAEDVVNDTDPKSKKKKKPPTKRIVRRFKQREAVVDASYEEDIDEKRARAASKRLEAGDDAAGASNEVDEELVRLLFDKKNRRQG